MWKLKCTTHLRVGALLEDEIWKSARRCGEEARLEVNMYKMHQLRTTLSRFDGSSTSTSARRFGAKHSGRRTCTSCTSFGPLLHDSMAIRCRKVHAVVAESTLGSKHVQDAPASDHCFTIRWQFDVEKCTPLWREAHLEVKSLKRVGFRVSFCSLQVTTPQLPVQAQAQVQLPLQLH